MKACPQCSNSYPDSYTACPVHGSPLDAEPSAPGGVAALTDAGGETTKLEMAGARGSKSLPIGLLVVLVAGAAISVWWFMLPRTHTIQGHSDWVAAVAFSSDGRTLASGSLGTIEVWDAASRRLSRTLEGQPGWILSVVFSPDGRTLASRSNEGSIRIWNLASGETLHTWQGERGDWPYQLAFSPDSRTLAWPSGKGEAVSDVVSGEVQRTLGPCAESAAFSPDGHTLALGGAESSINLWDLDSGQLLRTLKGRQGSVRSVSFSSDGRTLASWEGEDFDYLQRLQQSDSLMLGFYEAETRLWDVASGRQLHEARTDPLAKSVAFSPDSRTLASGRTDGAIKLSDVTSGNVLRCCALQFLESL